MASATVVKRDTPYQPAGGYARVVIPAGTPCVPATNLPPDSDIKYWVAPNEYEWDTLGWAGGYGYGLTEDEVMPAPQRTATLHLRHRRSQGTVEVTDDMVVNPQDFIPANEYNPHNVRPWIIGHEFGPFAIVFASCESDAMDIAIDEGKLDHSKVPQDELDKMTQDEIDEAGYLCGGNASEYFYQDYLWMQDIPNPKFSFIALLEAQR